MDVYEPQIWLRCESYWVIVKGVTVGCTALERDADYNGSPRAGSLFIWSTGVLPEFQRKGYGTIQKMWQIEYAKQNRFSAIVTCTRKSNEPMIRLNKKFGFVVRELKPDYYQEPAEPAMVMELDLSQKSDPCG
jgi:ribosomal protein S18 acetylase RimI-like enzyme